MSITEIEELSISLLIDPLRRHMMNLVKVDSGNSLVPDGTKLLFE